MADETKYEAELKSRRRERPFRPFVIHTNTGRQLKVAYAFGFAINVKGILVPGQGGPLRFNDIASIVDAPSLEATY